jgi:hypothetical protein
MPANRAACREDKQQQLAREINPKVFSVREWKSKLREQK